MNGSEEERKTNFDSKRKVFIVIIIFIILT
jgi:hypothetical protein